MTNTIFKADNITHDYKDKKKLFHAIKNISFELHAGEVISFVGPNGAGKTTLIKSISNYLVPTSGQVEVEGVDLIKYPRKARKKMGIVFGGDRGFYYGATARENLEFFARVVGVKERNIKSGVQEALKQRLHIARGLVNHPKILMLDEPTAGLDIESVISIRQLVKRIASEKRGIILTSHNMSDIESLADRIFLIGGGMIHFEGSIQEVKKFAGVENNASLADAYLAVADQLKRRQV